MWFEYRGFTVHRLGLSCFLVTGPGLWGYAVSENEARQIIGGIVSAQCEE